MDFAAQARDELLPLIRQVLDLAGGPATLALRVPVEALAAAPGGSATNGAFAGVSGASAFAEAADRPFCAFFTGILQQAQAMRAEADVVQLFVELSATAFLGFQYEPEVAVAIDDLFAAAERIAFTMAAPVDHPH
jgi:hypothetical protein